MNFSATKNFLSLQNLILPSAKVIFSVPKRFVLLQNLVLPDIKVIFSATKLDFLCSKKISFAKKFGFTRY